MSIDTAIRVFSVDDHAPHQLEHAVERAASRRARRHLPGRHVQLHRRAHESLQQRVVKILGDARPFRKPLLEANVELPGDLVHA